MSGRFSLGRWSVVLIEATFRSQNGSNPARFHSMKNDYHGRAEFFALPELLKILPD